VEYNGLFLEVLKYEESHLLRERLSRDFDTIMLRLMPEIDENNNDGLSSNTNI